MFEKFSIPMDLDLNTAAQQSGIHRSSIFRAIQKGELFANKSQLSGHKASWMLDSDAFQEWVTRRLTGAKDSPNLSQNSNSSNDSARMSDAEKDSAGANDSGHLSSSVNDSRMIHLLENANRVALEALRQADEARAQLDDARERYGRTERKLLSVASELESYKRVLTDQAESLAEERARRLTAEAKAELAAQVVHHGPGSSPVGESTDVCGVVASKARVREGWGRRMRRWFLGEKTA